MALTRYVSLGSLIGASIGGVALAVMAIMGVEPVEYVWYGAVASLIIIVRHKDNIQRLIRGEERKIGQKA